jgi:hypothetical protein
VESLAKPRTAQEELSLQLDVSLREFTVTEEERNKARYFAKHAPAVWGVVTASVTDDGIRVVVLADDCVQFPLHVEGVTIEVVIAGSEESEAA